MKKKQGVHYLEFSLLSKEKGLVHGVFSRQGGVSPSPFASLNVSYSVGDLPENVKENRQKIQSVLGCHELLALNQVHGKSVIAVKKMPFEPISADGFFTHLIGVALMIQLADCQAALFYDPVHRVIGNAHAGWKGNVQNIYQAMIEAMGKEYGTRPQDLLVCISPSLGPSAAEFKNYKMEFPESFWRFKGKDDRFNLWDLARGQLEESGVLPEHIEIASVCTYNHPEEWFSFRRDKITGRHAAVIALVNRSDAQRDLL